MSDINNTLESLQLAADELNKKIAALKAAKNVVDEVNAVEQEAADDFSDFEFEEIDNSCHKAKSGSGK